MEFINKVLAAEYDFEAIGQFFKKLFNESFTGTVESIWDTVWGMLSVIHPFVAYVLIALGAFELLFGKRLLNFQKILIAFAVGFGASGAYLAPMVAESVPAIADFAWVIGIVVGIIAILLRKVVYMVLYLGAAAYIPYYLMYSGKVVEGFAENLIFAAAAAGVAVFVALLLRKWVETLGLAAFGAWAIVDVLADKLGVVDTIQGLIGGVVTLEASLIRLILLGVIALIGFSFQVKTRKRY